VETLKNAMIGTIDQLDAWGREAGATEPSYYNFAMTDGESVVATRYVNHPTLEPLSLYYSSGSKFECRDGDCRMITANRDEHAVIIASEPLTDAEQDWASVPRNHLVTVASDLTVEVLEIR
jgi:glutamine amidotransferase